MKQKHVEARLAQRTTQYETTLGSVRLPGVDEKMRARIESGGYHKPGSLRRR